jgi:hypothetical protein
VDFLEEPGLEGPLVQRLAALPEPVLLALVGTGEVAVGGDGDLALDLAHGPTVARQDRRV